ncbi:MAG: cytochrome c biogenesis protein CcdA [Gemmatimonadaceae bacterium]|nr:cytochrome c biogenesis protein CcdA [Gemmatimonadaceae bacterium]
MEPASIGLLVAFSAGLLSFLSPCVLPLIPSYITFITGLSFDEVQSSRRVALVHGLLFVLGFSLIFLALGATATVIGRVLFSQRDIITKIGGVMIIVFGLYLVGVLNIGFFARERRVHLANKPVGYLGTVLVGIAFGAGWTPCIGPILGSILLYASTEADLPRGLALLTAYSLGLGVPFILSALAVDRFMSFFQKFKKQMMWMQRGAGVLMIGIGVLMITNQFTILASYLQQFTPEFILKRL